MKTNFTFLSADGREKVLFQIDALANYCKMTKYSLENEAFQETYSSTEPIQRFKDLMVSNTEGMTLDSVEVDRQD